MKYKPSNYLLRNWKDSNWRRNISVKKEMFNILEEGDVDKIKEFCLNQIEIIKIKKRTSNHTLITITDILNHVEKFERLELRRGKL